MKQVISTNNQSIISIEEAVDEVGMNTIIVSVNNLREVEFLMRRSTGMYMWRLPYTQAGYPPEYKTIKMAIEDAIKLDCKVYIFCNTDDFRDNFKNIQL